MSVAGLELPLEIEIDGRFHLILVDTGASVSMVKPGIVASEIQGNQIAARGITGRKLKVRGIQVMTYKVVKRIFTHECLIAPLDGEYSGILGADVLRQMEASIDFRTSTLTLGRKRYQLSGQEVEMCRAIRHQSRPLQGTSEAGRAPPLKALPRGKVKSLSQGRAREVPIVIA
jgi:predicted aspartyl protease